MANTTHAGFIVTSPLTGRLTTPPRRTILSRIGAWLFASCDAEASWRGWEVHERHLGLGRRYRDPRFGQRDTWTDPVESGDAAAPDAATGTAAGGE